uniref:response regulator n=1 Tax=Arenibaculum pallidiluteum TaxID=2812559 RepID=UPI001A95CC40
SGVPIDLMFTDVVMPGPLRSPELARKARERMPGIAVLFTSGYTENALVHGGRLDDDVELLSKPYTREKLARKIRHTLRKQEQRNDASAAGFRTAPSHRMAGDARSLHVLLVEDDDLIRLSTAEMLEGLGHTVQEARTATEAVTALDARVFDVLLTDIGLGRGRSGIELATEARRKNAALRLVFVSGYDLPPGTMESDLLAGAILLRKPFDEIKLADALLASLARSSV